MRLLLGNEMPKAFFENIFHENLSEGDLVGRSANEILLHRSLNVSCAPIAVTLDSFKNPEARGV
jgi:hypothetical protein